MFFKEFKIRIKEFLLSFKKPNLNWLGLLMVTSFGLILVLSIAKTNYALAAINPEINYQGKLLDSTATPVNNGDYDITVNLYTDSEGGSPIFTETQTVPVQSGLFSMMIGSTTSLTEVDFNQTLYLGVEINSDGEMTPRKRLGAVPTAFVADKLDNYDSTDFLSTSTESAPKLAFLSGLVSFGSSTATTTVAGNLAIMGDALINGILTTYNTLTAPNFIATSTTAASIFPYASSTAISATGLIQAGHLLATGSSTFQNITFVLATGTAATTTSLFTTGAFATHLSVGTTTTDYALTVDGLSYLSTTTIGQSLTVGNPNSDVSLGIGDILANSLNFTASSSLYNDGSNMVLSDETVGPKTLSDLLAGARGCSQDTNSVLSGGVVTYSGTGFTFDISPTVYCIRGLQYSIGASQVTLTDADSTYDRIDSIIVDNSSQATYLTGTPATAPGAPVADPDSQIALTLVFVGANSTQPGSGGAGPVQEKIYLNNAEWTGSQTTPGGEVDFNSSTDPQQGARNVEVTTPLKAADYFQFASSSGTWNPTGYATLSFYIKVKTAFTANNDRLVLTFRSNTGARLGSAVTVLNGRYGFDRTNTTSYQKIAIPLADFGTIGTAVKYLRFTGQTAAAVNSLNFRIDTIVAEGTSQGSATQLTSGSILFAGTSGVISENNANFFWDNTNYNLGLGTTSPYAKLSVVGQAVASYFTATSTTNASTFPYASSTALTVAGTLYVGSLNGPLQANAGRISATTSIGVLYGGTGLTTAPSYGNLLVGNNSGGYTLTATSGLGIAISDTTGTLAISRGGTGTTTFQNGGVVFSDGSKLTQDSTNFFWDDTNNRLGIGTTSPFARLSVDGGVTFQGDSFATTTIGNRNTSIVIKEGNYDGSFGNIRIPIIVAHTATSDIDPLYSLGVNNEIVLFEDPTLNLDPALSFSAADFGNTFNSASIKFATSTGSFDLTSAATTTADRGINLSDGCFAVNDVCIGGGSSQWDNITGGINYAGGVVGIGTTTPATDLSVAGNGYLTGGLGVGLVNTTAGTLKTSGNATVGGSLLISSVLNCNSASQALQTDGSGTVSCGSIVAGGSSSSGGGWVYLAPDIVRLGTTTDLVGVGTTSPYAKVSINSGSVATTTLALVPVSSQTANILDIYNSDQSLGSVINAGGFFGLGTTSPYAKLSVVGQAVASYFTATSTTNASTFPYASSTALTVAGTLYVGSLNGPLQANAGRISATTSIGVLYGGTGLTTAPSYGNLLVGNNSGGYTLTATSGLGIAISDTTGTLAVARGGTGVTTFGGTNTLLYTTSADTLAAIATTNTGALVTNSSGAPSWTSGTTANRVLRTDGTTVSFAQVALATDVSGTLAIGNGGTGLASTPSYGQLLLGDNSSGYTLTATSGLGIAISDTTGTLAISRGGTGTTTFQNGGVVFSDGSKLTQDSTNFFWDDTNNRLGIGTTSPFARLSVTGGGTGTGKAFLIADSANTPRFVIQDNGLVGIGTTTPIATLTVAASGRAGELFLADQSSGFIDSSTKGGTYLASDNGLFTISGMNSQGLGSQVQFTIDQVNNLVGIGTATPSANLAVNFDAGQTPFVVGSSTATKFIIDSLGYVGIGSSSPNKALSVSGTAMFANNNTNGFVAIDPQLDLVNGVTGEAVAIYGGDASTNRPAILRLRNVSSTYDYDVLVDTDNKFKINSDNDGGSGLNLLTIVSSGNAGFGSSTPFAKLSVTGSGTGSGYTFLTADSANTPRFLITDAGNVGVGTTSPLTKLSVSGTGGQSYGLILASDSADSDFTQIDPNYGVSFSRSAGYINNNSVGGSVVIRTSGSSIQDRISATFLSTGQVGIGTTTPARPLTVYRAGERGGLLLVDGAGTPVDSTKQGGTYLSSEAGVFGIAGNNSVGAGTAQYLTIDQVNSKTGIASTSPVSTLSVGGDIWANNPSSATTALRLESSEVIRNDSSTVYLGQISGTSLPVTIRAGGSDRMYIINTGANAGNVGIGTSSPYARLSVAGDIVGDNLRVTSIVSTSTTATSTFGWGINLSGGCFAINSTCVAGGGVTAGVNSGTINTLAYYSSASAVSSKSTLTVYSGSQDVFQKTVLGISTSSPEYGNLKVQYINSYDGPSISNWYGSTTYISSGQAFESGLIGLGGGTGAGGGATYLSTGGDMTDGFSTGDGGVGGIAFIASGGDAFGGGDGGTGGTTNIAGGGDAYSDGTGGAGGTVTLAAGGESYISPGSFGNDGVVNIGNASTSSRVKKNANLRIWGRVGIATTTSTSGNDYLIVGPGGSTVANVRVPKGSICVDDDGACTPSGTAGTVTAVLHTTAHSDVAEDYYSTQSLKVGEIVMPNGEANIVRADKTNNKAPLGVVSEKPGIILGFNNDDPQANRYPIALVGRVPVLVNLDGGEIKVGDKLVLSDVPGVATKATVSGNTIGTALESFTTSSTKDDNGIGKVLMFVDLSYTQISDGVSNGQFSQADMWQLADNELQLAVQYSLNFNNQELKNIKSLISASGNWSIDENGVLLVKEVRTDKLCVGSICITQSDLEKMVSSAGLILTSSTTNSGSALIIPPGFNSLDGNTSSTPPVATSTESAVGTSTPEVEASSTPSVIEEENIVSSSTLPVSTSTPAQ